MTKRWRTENAFKARRLGAEPGSFNRFLEKLKKAEAREQQKRMAPLQIGARKELRRRKSEPKKRAAEKRRQKSRAVWDPRRDRLHLALMETGLEPIGVGGVVTDRDLERVKAIYGEPMAKRLASHGAGHRWGYALSLPDMILVRLRPEEWTSRKLIYLRNREYAKNSINSVVYRLLDQGLIEKAATGFDGGMSWKCRWVKNRPEMYVFRLTDDGETRRDGLIASLDALGEPVSAVLACFAYGDSLEG